MGRNDGRCVGRLDGKAVFNDGACVAVADTVDGEAVATEVALARIEGDSATKEGDSVVVGEGIAKAGCMVGDF